MTLERSADGLLGHPPRRPPLHDQLVKANERETIGNWLTRMRSEGKFLSGTGFKERNEERENI